MHISLFLSIAAFLSAQTFGNQAALINKSTIKEISASLPTPKLQVNRASQKELTIMIFMNGKNNLADYVLKDINEMEVYGPRADMNIVV